ncbi:MAG: AAA family ATPase [Gulosibacter sp.]|uniref:AAA family ATPase n=1 Tax=Gulosibacter sp. TaxID=2817531 RepID=UPI003F8DBC16
MKLLTLTVEGFGPFRRKQCIDFTDFEEEGLFLIGGKTGAGKSTVLDAIMFALYGSTPRYEGTPRGVRSNFSGPDEVSEVQLEFEHGGEQYRVTRSPEYEALKKRGEGTTTRPGKQEIARLEGDTWVSLFTLGRNVAAEISRIFPLQAEEFLQVVMLAQNEFQKFLHADSADRQKLLRKLFHTERYHAITELLGDRARESGQRYEQLNAEVNQLADSLARRRSDLSSASDEAAESDRERTGTAAAATDQPDKPTSESKPPEVSAEWIDEIVALAERIREERVATQRERSDASTLTAKRLTDALRIQGLQQRRAKAIGDRTELLADQERIDTEVIARLETDDRAIPLVPAVESFRKTESALQSAVKVLKQAGDSLAQELQAEVDAERTPPASPTERDIESIRAVQRELTEQLGSLRENANIDSAVVAKQKSLESAKSEAREQEDHLQAVQQRAEARPAARTELASNLASSRERSQGRKVAADALTEATNKRKAAQELPALEAERLEAATELDQALTDSNARQEKERALNAQRWLGAAASLAADLVPGAPCQVCGSLEHPAPATSEVATVTDADLKRAEQATTQAAQRVEKARSKKDAAVTAAEQTRAATAGLNREEAETREAEAKAALRRIKEAESAISRLETELQELDEAAERDSKLTAELTAARDHARTLVTTTETELNELLQRQASLRGQHESVRDRLNRSSAIEQVCGRFVIAFEAQARAEAEAKEAKAHLAAALDPSPFDSATAVLEARLDASTRKTLVQEQDTHAKKLHAATELLNDPELAQLPEAPVDVEQPTALDEEARVALETANRALGEADSILKEIRTTSVSAKSALDRRAAIGERARAEKQLAADLSGKNERMQNLEAFVLAAHLEQILDAANSRLKDITANRYELELDDELAGRGRQSGLGLKIFDVYNGKSRAPKSLSGGETFLVSLALALGLADVVSSQAGGITLDTLFIDEGFGSLDSDTLEIAMRTLDQLREGGRTIGVISHVGTMQERIPAHLNVIVSPDGSSDISTDVFATDPVPAPQ